MLASFDGMRKNATNSMNKLHKVLIEVIKDEMILDSLKKDVIEAFNNLAQNVDVMNCLYDPSDEDDMNDLSDVLSINRLDDLEKNN